MGLIVVDAGILIAVLDSSDVHHDAALGVLRIALNEGSTIVLPASAYAEVLVAPFRRDGGSASLVDSLVDALPAAIHPITRSIARSAAQLRAIHGNRLRLPDALVIATALDLNADHLLTTDRRWPTVGMEVRAI